MTQKLYDIDSHLFRFRASVLSCEERKNRWEIVLNETAFFPEGGGQPGDRGTLGGIEVLDTHERDGEVIHYCSGPLEVGAQVEGEIDRELRLGRMQNHSGEHILSGTAHRLYGCENVGFHMSENDVTIDFDVELSAEDVARIETLANDVVRENLPIRICYPSKEELATLEYRSKKELTGDVRIVEIPGVDRCACCAPHVSMTGEVATNLALAAQDGKRGQRAHNIGEHGLLFLQLTGLFGAFDEKSSVQLAELLVVREFSTAYRTFLQTGISLICFVLI